MSNITRKWLKKSPFMVATVGGTTALVADMVWLMGELSTHFGLISETTYLFIRFGILASLMVGFAACVYGVHLYVNNGYVRADMAIRKECLMDRTQHSKRSKIMK